MSFKSLQNLATDFASSWYLASTSKSFHLITESEINGLKNTSYPLCVVEPPSSKISDINKAREEYDLTCFILIKKSSREVEYNPASLYDESLSLFNNFIGFLAAQRNGQYLIDRESFAIERVSRFGADMSIGIKVDFTLLAPSKLAFAGATVTLPALPYTTDLFSYHNSIFGVTTTENSMSWLPLIDNSGETNDFPFALTSEETDQVPTLTTRNTIAFSAPKDTNSSEVLLNNFAAIGGDFTIFVTLQVPGEADVSGYSTIFNIKGDSNGAHPLEELTLKIQTFGDSKGTIYLESVQDREAGTIPRLVSAEHIIPASIMKPYGALGSPQTVAFVHEPSDERVKIFWQRKDGTINKRTLGENSSISAIGNLSFRLGAKQVGTDNESGLIGEVSNLVIYDDLVSDSNVESIMLALNEL